MKKIVLAGGNGYLGRVLQQYYADKAKQIIVLSRSKHPDPGPVHFAVWDGKTPGAWTSLLEGADLLINLSGKNVNCRYTPANRKEIMESRTQPTALLARVVAGLAQPPSLWINLASATIYRHAEDGAQSEAGGETGNGFSIDVCRAWEDSFFSAATPGVRKVALRTAIVLGKNDGVLPRLRNLVRAGLGGHQGNGMQKVSWLHELDFARITEWAFHHAPDGSVYNAAAPEVVSNAVLMQALRKTYGAPFGLPAPAWLLEIGARIIGTETELILKSRWVAPERLLAEGFSFRFPALAVALQDIAER